MAKYFGMIGFGTPTKLRPGVVSDEIVERPYRGDFTRRSWRNEAGDGINDNLTISNELSIVADAFANQNFHLMKYISYQGVKWKVKSVEIRYPRLILQIGGVYNDKSGPSSSTSG